MRAAVERNAEAFGIGDAASADMVGCFDDQVTPSGSRDFARRGDAGRAGADNDDIERAGRRRSAEGRTCNERGGGGEERTAA